MNNNTQTNNDLQAGFLIKDKSGQFKKVKDNEVVDYQPVSQQSQNVQQSTPIQKQSEPKFAVGGGKPPQKPFHSNDKSESKPPLQTPRAVFMDEPDDVEEIRKHQEELDKILSETSKKDVVTKSDPNAIIDVLINKFKLKFESEIYKKRFAKIVESRIREVRSAIETEEVLHRIKKIGGLELDVDIAKNIVKELKNTIKDSPKIEEIHQERDNISPIPKEEEVQKQTMFASAPPAFIPMPLVPEKKEPKHNKQAIRPDQVKKIEPLPEKSVEIQTPKPEKKVSQSPEDNKYQQNQKELMNKLYTKTPSEAMAKIAKARQAEPDRPQVIDIRQPSAIIGPVEEIKEIDLKEFRRMGENPSGSAEKVLEKIYLLEEDSWVERMKGLHSWQQSPIYKLYIDIGRASIDSSLPVAQIISQRESEGKKNLHMEEFLAINDLNNQLAI